MKVLIISWSVKRPKEAIIIDFKTKKHSHIVLWKKGNNETISKIIDKETQLKEIVDSSDEITIINYKKYHQYFGNCGSQELFDYQMEYDNFKEAIKIVQDRQSEFGQKWQSIRADSAEVYNAIEKRGILVEHKLVYPTYSMDVYSGRSKTTGFNIQGMGPGIDIRHPDLNNQLIIKFDWIAADMRMAAYLSKDQELMESFYESDPYSYIEASLDGKASRDECKPILNKAVNSLNDNNLIFNIFPRFGEWIKEQKKVLKDKGHVESILGRRFYTDHTLKGDRRAFNGTLQGSVAHAMQATISNVFENCGDIILTEQHDSLTVCSNEKKVSSIIKTVSKIMKNPFDEVIMPLRVEIGKSWGNYKKVREIR